MDAKEMAKKSHERFSHLSTPERAHYFNLVRQGKKREAKQYLRDIPRKGAA